MRVNKADELKMKEIAKKEGLTYEEVKEICHTPYEFISKTTKKMNIKEGMTKEEFSKLKTNFNIPSICKMYASHYIYSKINNNKNKK